MSFKFLCFSSQGTSRGIGWFDMAARKSNTPVTGTNCKAMAMSLNESNFNEIITPWKQHKIAKGRRPVLSYVVSSFRNIGAWRT